MTNPIEHIHKLAVEIGPRPSTSPQERAAANYGAEFLSGLGLEVTFQHFHAPATWTWFNFLGYLLALLGIILYLVWPPLGLVLTAVAAIAAIAENDNRPFLSRLVPKRESQNVVGVLRPQNEVRRRVICLAHLDTARSDSAHHPDRVTGFRTTYLLSAWVLISLATLYLVGTVVYFIPGLSIPWRLEWWLSLPLGLVLVYIEVLLIQREREGEFVAGANDNASGVACTLATAEHFASHPLQHTELWTVLTGCEEVAANGAVEFLRARRGQLDNALVLCPDNCGAGRAIYAVVEGMFFAHHAGPALVRLAEEIRAADPDLDIHPAPYRAGYTDGSAALVRGFQALSMLGLDERGVPPNWHWPTDNFDNVDEATVNTTAEFMRLMIERIDRLPAPA
ncbi:MAG: M28 family peptidase [Chloroflexota bacterium]|nr:M28 family peptidase [Chloroflexota bacterium]